MQELSNDHSRLGPYAPSLLQSWSPADQEPRHMRVTGSLAFVDISGFTRLTERLSRTGKAGAEEMSDILDATFAALLHEAMAEGADLVKWGGDAVLLLFQGEGHALRAARAAHRMRSTLRQVGRISTSSGVVVLRMSVGMHSGEFDFFLVGDPAVHRELLVCGPGVSATAELESAAGAGQIGLSAASAAALPERVLGGPLLDGRLLRALPAAGPPATDEAPPASGTSVSPAETLPPPVRAHLMGGAGDAEHRAITVAFVQYAGSDELLVREGPTALAAALDELVRTVQHACADHEVTFFESDISRDGGKIMLVAGAPRSADHLEERMLRVAREVLDHGGRLPLRIGVNRGHVFAGDFGPSFRRTYSVKGDAINLAARLLGRADPGQALATSEVLSHSQTDFRAEPLPPFRVKGKARPVNASVLGALLGTRGERDLDVELTGRADELATLSAALEEARGGRGRTVEVVGEPGLGKSRLVTEVVRGSGAEALRTRCDAYQASTAYYPFRRLLRDALQLPDEPGPAAARLQQQVTELTPWLAAWTPLLGIPLDLALPPTPETTELDPQFLVPRLEGMVVELLAAALPGTSVLVLEDVHDLDDASAALLQRLCAEAARRPWLVLLTRREQPTPPDWLAGITARTTLQLAPLDEAASMDLARRALVDRPLTPHTIRVLVHRSGGNPMFLAALLDAAQRSGDLSQLPDTVEALVTSDIDRLAPSDRRALRYAAVLGSVVDVRVLDALMALHGGLDGNQFGRLDGFLERGRAGRLRFRNVLLRDVAYEGLPYRSRRLLHEQVGSAIEQGTDDADSLAETLSLHFFHAGNETKAWRYSVVAGRRAVEKHAHGDAVDFLVRATQAVPRDGSVTAAERTAALEQLADSRFVLGLTTEAIDAYAAARRVAGDDPVRQALLVAKEVRVDVRRRRFPQAMRRLSRGLHRLEGIPGRPADAARSRLARRYAYSRYAQGRIDEALRWAEAAARHAESSHDKGALAQAYEMLNGIYAGSGRTEPVPYGRLALQANRELGDLPRQGHCLNNLAVEAFTHGRWDEALAQYRQAGQIFRRTGDSASEVNAAYNQAELLVRQGRFAEAAELLPEVLLVARAVEDEELVALALREQAQVQAATGDPEGGMSLLDDVRRRFDLLEEPHELVVTDLVRVETLVRAGRSQDAGHLLAELVPAGGRAHLDGISARWHRLWALVHRSSGDLASAREAILVGLERASGDGDLFEQALLLREMVALTQLLGEAEDPDAVARARGLLDSLGVVAPS
ncbi:MAG: adenylate/guanylate cyclase domain-containing protein [Nocardioides sp.]